jgi:hypothetical protein
MVVRAPTGARTRRQGGQRGVGLFSASPSRALEKVKRKVEGGRCGGVLCHHWRGADHRCLFSARHRRAGQTQGKDIEEEVGKGRGGESSPPWSASPVAGGALAGGGFLCSASSRHVCVTEIEWERVASFGSCPSGCFVLAREIENRLIQIGRPRGRGARPNRPWAIRERDATAHT